MSCILRTLVQLREEMRDDEALKTDVTMLAVIDALAVAAVVACAYFYCKWWSMHPLFGRNNGPKVYPIVGSIIPYLRNRHRSLDYNTEWLRKVAGNTVRAVRPINRCVFITANPANVEYILKTNFVNFPKGELINKHLRFFLGDGIFNADDHLWKIQRQVASYEFTTRSLNDFGLETAQREANQRLLPVLSAAAQSGQSLDMQDIFFRFAFDNICQLGFGVDPACLSLSLPTVKVAEAFDTATRISFSRFQSFPHWLWTFKKALDVGKAKELRLAISLIDDFAMGVIENRRQELALTEAKLTAAKADDGDSIRLQGDRTDLLSRFMTLVNIGDDEKDAPSRTSTSSPKRVNGSAIKQPSNVFLRDMIISFILAGRDTSTSALSWFFWLLSVHPKVELAILEEISVVLRSRRASDLNDEDDQQKIGSDLSFQELKGMHYLTAALMESMRLYPPVPFNFKTAREADELPSGEKVAAGSFVGYHPYAMGRMEHLWGKDCLSFRPERWLNDQDGSFVPASPYKFPVFHAGPRICLGKDLVMMQMKVVCVAVLNNFQLTVSRNYQPEPLLSLNMRVKNGLPVTLRRRTTSSSPGVKS